MVDKAVPAVVVEAVVVLEVEAEEADAQRHISSTVSKVIFVSNRDFLSFFQLFDYSDYGFFVKLVKLFGFLNFFSIFQIFLEKST